MKFNRQQWHFVFVYIRQIVHRFREDQITVYAAQASFFVILSAMPFLSLLVAIVSFFTPVDVQTFFKEFAFSEGTLDMIDYLFTELQTAPKIPLLSLSAIVTLWSASRGTAAIRRGIETIYHSKSPNGYLLQRLKSLLSTLSLIFLVVATVVLLLFGNLISTLIGNINFTDIILCWRTPFFISFMCIVFTAVYISAAKRSTEIKSNISSQLPGAVFASTGWILFSYMYSLYIRFFPNASYIYGGLAAVCLIMLWLYFCMLILLLGAECNKLYPTWKKKF